MESIVVINATGMLWCGFIDIVNSAVRYYTNDLGTLQSIPKPMQDWLSKFPGRKKILNNIETTEIQSNQ
ncbi:MAG: hypothetical protein ACJ748_13035 [Flavisolibacter sp.]